MCLLHFRENLRLMKQFYPGWVMRLYYHRSDVAAATLSGLCEVACADPALDLCDAADNPRLGDMQILHPQMWRFMPAVDVQASCPDPTQPLENKSTLCSTSTNVAPQRIVPQLMVKRKE